MRVTKRLGPTMMLCAVVVYSSFSHGREVFVGLENKRVQNVSN